MAICFPEAFGELGGTSPVPKPQIVALPSSSYDVALAVVLLDCMECAMKFEKYDGWDDPRWLDTAARKIGFKSDSDLRREGSFVYIEKVRGGIFMYPTARRGKKVATFEGLQEIKCPSAAPTDLVQTFMKALSLCR